MGARETADYLYAPKGVVASWIAADDVARIERRVPPSIFRRYYMNEWVDEVGSFIDIGLWDTLKRDIPPLEPREAVVLGVDAAASGDCFAVIAVSRDRERPGDAVWVRSAAVWRPSMFAEGRIEFSVPETYIRDFCAQFRVAQLCYDPYQMEDMAQRFARESRVSRRYKSDAISVWCSEFQQGKERAIADTGLLSLIRQGRIAHDGDAALREHVGNAALKVAVREDTNARLVKKAPDRKIDAVVALSMAASRCLALML